MSAPCFGSGCTSYVAVASRTLPTSQVKQTPATSPTPNRQTNGLSCLPLRLVYPSVWPSARPTVGPAVIPFTRSSVSPSVCHLVRSSVLLSPRLPICVFVCPALLSVCLSFCLSVSLPALLTVFHVSVRPSVLLLSLCLLCLSVLLSLCPYVTLSFCLFNSSSFCLFVCLFVTPSCGFDALKTAKERAKIEREREQEQQRGRERKRARGREGVQNFLTRVARCLSLCLLLYLSLCCFPSCYLSLSLLLLLSFVVCFPFAFCLCPFAFTFTFAIPIQHFHSPIAVSLLHTLM